MNTPRTQSRPSLRISLILAFLLAWTALAATAQTKRLTASEYRVIEVAPVPGDDYASGTALLNANASAASSPHHWLLSLSPGTYDLGGRELQMEDNVSIEGSGMESTFILGQGTTEPNLGRGVIMGADNTRLAELTLRCSNSSTSDYCIAMANVNASPRLHRVRIEVFGPGLHWGMRNTNSSPLIEEAEIFTSDGSHNYAVVNSFDSHPEIQRSILAAENGSTQNIGVFGADGGLATRIDDTEIYAIGNGQSVGLYNDGVATESALVLDDVKIDAGGGSTLSAAVYGGNYDLQINGSTLRSGGPDSKAVELEINAKLLAIDSELMGDSVSAIAGVIQLGSSRIGSGEVLGSSTTCTGVYRLDSTPAFFADTCPSGSEAFRSKSMIRIVEAGS